MSVIGFGGGGALFDLDSEGMIISSTDVHVNGTLYVPGAATIDGGVYTSAVTTGPLTATAIAATDGVFESVTTDSLISYGNVRASGLVSVNNDGADTGQNHGLRYFGTSDSYVSYMARAGTGRSANGGVATAGGLADTSSAFDSYAIRTRMTADTARGFLFENTNDECVFSVRADGRAYVSTSLLVGAGGIDCRGPLTVNGVATVAPADLNDYLTKSQYNTDNLTETLKEVAQAAWNAATETSIESLEATTQILGASLIAGTFTLSGQLVENVDAAFLNVDGRLLSVAGALTLTYTKTEADGLFATKAYVDAELASIPTAGNLTDLEIIGANALTLSIANTQGLVLVNRAITGNHMTFDTYKRGGEPLDRVAVRHDQPHHLIDGDRDRLQRTDPVQGQHEHDAGAQGGPSDDLLEK